MLKLLKQDYQKPFGVKSSMFGILFRFFRQAEFRSVALYRIGNWFHRRDMTFAGAFVERVMHHSCHCWISTRATIGPGFRIAHVGGIIIHPKVEIGKNCTIRQNVTIGGNYGRQDETGNKLPIVGDNVSIGPSASILGPINIGSNSIIGANAVVTKSVPLNSVVASQRATVIGYVSDGEINIRKAVNKGTDIKDLIRRIEKIEHELKKEKRF